MKVSNRKKIGLTIAGVAFTAAVMTFNVNNTRGNRSSMDLILQNTEALAQSEGSDCHYTNGYRQFYKQKGSGAYLLFGSLL